MDTETTTETLPEAALEGAEARPRVGRRSFLRRATIAGAALPMVGGLIISACYEDPTSDGRTKPTAIVPAANVRPAVVDTAAKTAAHAAEIDDGHKKGLADFLANQKTPLTKGKGNQPLASTVENGVRIFNLTVEELQWEVAPGQFEKARGFNGTVPGPILRATEGERVRINVKNNLLDSTTIHWHGLLVPNNQDGVGWLTQDPIKAGATYTYEFTLRNSGSHMYHSHHDSSDQVNRGLLGAFIVAPKDKASYPAYDREYILILNDSLLGFTLNGKAFPATEALVAKKGERVLIRWMNEGMMYHPMHLHGMPMEVFARDGYPINPPYKCDTIDVPPGNRFDCIIQADEPGAWAFHCHVLSHAENTTGFFGLVTALVITE